MQLTQIATRTDVAVKVANAIAVVALTAVILATFGSIARSFGFVSTSTTATTFNCTDTDGGKNFPVKGIVKVTSASSVVTVTDSCKSASTLNETFCDPIRKYANAVTQNCIEGCGNGSCLKASTTMPRVSAFFVSQSNRIIFQADNPAEYAGGQFVIKFRVVNFSIYQDIWIDKDQVFGVINPSTTTNGLAWTIDTTVLTATSSPHSSSLISSSSDSNDSAYAFRVPKNSGREFDFVVNINPTAQAYYGTKINGIKWDIDSDDNTKYLISGSVLSNFVTSSLLLNAL